MNDSLKSLLAKAGPFLGLLVVIALFSIPTETREFFLTYHNFKTIFTQTVIVAIGALGMTKIIVSGGIDVGSKAQIYQLIGELAGAGKAVVVISSYLPELLGLCDTIGVMCRGELAAVRPRAEWSEAEIMRTATGSAGTA